MWEFHCRGGKALEKRKREWSDDDMVLLMPNSDSGGEGVGDGGILNWGK